MEINSNVTQIVMPGEQLDCSLQVAMFGDGEPNPVLLARYHAEMAAAEAITHITQAELDAIVIRQS